MLRTQVVKLARATPSAQRSFSVAAIRASEGDTGGIRPGGMASGDTWTRRENANETKFIREKEMERYLIPTPTPPAYELKQHAKQR
ncbi:hypothetical protein A1O1_06174 [Capronia coronata CBS 617.96]|uniref:ATPase inhibitor, mitochondrial n=1 Tax=Capronia coronata CBS 617.96 TaxID=1182541 RepID=W9Y846_9EURO|nr:uncharacterized protein A1O1_06174 [Capronia coronata CBS 617.96]EXJ85805.1 hypothetical protein A1O1_06174 [Capronia coronata CBS 617.96]